MTEKSLIDSEMMDELHSVSEFAKFGTLFKSSKPVALTEVDVAEYIVTCVKHMYDNHVIFQVCVPPLICHFPTFLIGFPNVVVPLQEYNGRCSVGECYGNDGAGGR